MSEVLLDRAGRRRSPATMPGFHAGRPPRNKGLRYPADPPRVEEIVAVMRAAGDGPHGQRLRGLIVVLWRAGLRIQEALSLGEADLDRRRGSLLVRHGLVRQRTERAEGAGCPSRLIVLPLGLVARLDRTEVAVRERAHERASQTWAARRPRGLVPDGAWGKLRRLIAAGGSLTADVREPTMRPGSLGALWRVGLHRVGLHRPALPVRRAR